MPKLFTWLVKPKSKDEDTARREFILNVLILGGLILTLIVTISARINLLRTTSRGGIDNGFPIDIVSVIILSLLVFYYFSKIGKSRFIAHMFIWIFLLPALYTSIHWGATVPQSLLVYALVIVMAGGVDRHPVCSYHDGIYFGSALNDFLYSN